MQTLPYDAQHLRHLAGEIITNVRELAHAGWTPATSSNSSGGGRCITSPEVSSGLPVSCRDTIRCPSQGESLWPA